MKNKDEVKIEGKPVFYAVLFNSMKKAALELGYTLTLHGSMHNDMDLIAVAWIDNAAPPEQLVQAIDDCIGHTVWKDHNITTMKKRPHGRLSYTISIMGDWVIDLSIIPPDSNEKDSIIYGLEEGADNWKREYDRCRGILQWLVDLKAIKDNLDKVNVEDWNEAFSKENDVYRAQKVKAWEEAKVFLSQYQHF